MSLDQSINAPKFLILGVQKAGTTTLFDILNGFDNFSGASKKEIHFFDYDDHYQRGLEWYLEFFQKKNNKITFEATPSYIYSKTTPQRIYETFGTMKFVVILRDPVMRCLSAWNMFRTFNSDKMLANHIYETFIKHSNPDVKNGICDLLFSENYPSFDECVVRDINNYLSRSSIEEPSFVRRGLYYEQIKRYLQYFKIEDFLFLDQSELNQDIEKVIMKIKFHLGIKDTSSICLSNLNLQSNVGCYEGTNISKNDKTILKLYDFYQKHNKSLFELINQSYPWTIT